MTLNCPFLLSTQLMQFQLPSNLQQELLAYDPALKKLAQETKAAAPKRKAKYPLGNLPRFIPDGIVTDAQWQQMVDDINKETAPNRFRYLHRIKMDENNRPYDHVYFMMYHWESVWYAAWLPPKGQEDQYVYGYAFAYRDTNATYDKLPHSIRTNVEITTTQVGRVTFAHRYKCMAANDICDNYYYNWKADYFQGHSKKGNSMRTMMDKFTNTIKTTIPQWDDSMNMFERIQAKNIYRALHYRYGGGTQAKEYFSTHKDVDDAVFTADDIYNLIRVNKRSDDEHLFNHVTEANQIFHIITKPFFRKWIQSRLDEMMQLYKDPGTKTRKEFQAKWNIIWKLFEQIHHINSIWPDCPIDYYQTNIDSILAIKLNSYPSPALHTKRWLTKHMPVASFFNELNKAHAAWQQLQLEEPSRIRFYFDHDYDMHMYSWSEWNDTISMLNNLACNGPIQLDPPRRWRMTDFHDHVQSAAWKIKNPNVDLPQDLFPEPIKVDGFSFFQPHDTHQLAQWGQAVRNCVGNASHYAEGVRKKQHFIVLAMYEGKPRFTIQLTLNHGVFDVKQIVGMSNSRLSDIEKEQCAAAFGEALTQRNKQLKSA